MQRIGCWDCWREAGVNQKQRKRAFVIYSGAGKVNHRPGKLGIKIA